MASLPQHYVGETAINGSPEEVWTVLTNAAGYAAWNPEIIRIDGDIALNARITAHVKLGGGAVRRVGLKVTALEAPSLMEWTGGLPFGLFVGIRTFAVTPGTHGATFTMHLHMSGLLAPLILKSVGNRQAEVDSFCAGLRRAVESV
jgi:hypothetical protein